MKNFLFLSILFCSNFTLIGRYYLPEEFRQKTGLLENAELMNVVREEIRNAQEILSTPNVRTACWQKTSDPRMKELWKHLPMHPLGTYPGKSTYEIINIIFPHLESTFGDTKEYSKIIAQKDAILSALNVAKKFYNSGFFVPTQAMIDAVAEKYELKDYPELLQKKRDAEYIVRCFEEGFLDVDSESLKTPNISEEVRKLEAELASIEAEYKTRMDKVNAEAAQGKMGMFNPMPYLKNKREIEKRIAVFKNGRQ